MNPKLATIALATLIILPVSMRAQAPDGKSAKGSTKITAAADAKQGTIEVKIEKYLRNLYAWGPAYEVKVETPKPTVIPDLLEVSVTISMGGQKDSALVYATKDGRYLVRGELADMTADPFADVRAKLHVGSSPSMGPENAKITLIEFADFECPSCRQLDLILRDFLPKHPEVRLVFKHFPLTEIHPWAMTAATASQCVYAQNPAAFWKFHDKVFDTQDLITPSNVWDTMKDLASQQGLDVDTFTTCMSNPETTKQIEQTMEEGRSLNLTATPTTFVNQRRVIGADGTQLDQITIFESVPN